MEEKPKSIWKKSLKGWRGIGIGWLILSFALIIIFLIWVMASGIPLTRSNDEIRLFGIVWIAITIAFLLATFIRYVCCWRNFKRFLFGFACFVTLIALFYAEEDWRGKHDWEQFKREQEANGENFDWQSVVPAPVPDEENFAVKPIVASSYEYFFDTGGHEVNPRNTNVVDRLTMISWRDNPWTNNPGSDSDKPGWPEAGLTDLKPWQDFFRSTPPPHSTWAQTNKSSFFPTSPEAQSPADDVLLALSKYDAAIEELRQAARFPYSRFPLTYDQDAPFGILLPHLAALKSSEKTLMLRTLAELQNGQNEKAFEDTKLMLRLVDSLRTEPFLISHLVRLAMIQLIIQTVYEGLAEHKWSDEQLAVLETELGKLDFLSDYGVAIRGERGLDVRMIEFLRNAPNKTKAFSNLSSDIQAGPDPMLALLALAPAGWFDRNEQNICAFYSKWYLPVANLETKTVSPASVQAAEKAFDLHGGHFTPKNILESVLLPNLSSAVKKFAYAQTSVDLARVAIALERYRLAHGEFPESLDVLAPKFIAELPHDVIGGQPLHYRRTADGQFVLYSIGWNETDDGGVVVFKKGSHPRDEIKTGVDIDQGDWVWKYPEKK